MRDFVYHAPTEVVFGKQSEEKVAGLVKCAAFALLVIGTAWALGKFGIKIKI